MERQAIRMTGHSKGNVRKIAHGKTTLKNYENILIDNDTTQKKVETELILHIISTKYYYLIIIYTRSFFAGNSIIQNEERSR